MGKLRLSREDFVFSAPHAFLPNPVEDQLLKTTPNENQNVFLLRKAENDELFISEARPEIDISPDGATPNDIRGTAVCPVFFITQKMNVF